jgi:hypothetical protein
MPLIALKCVLGILTLIINNYINIMKEIWKDIPEYEELYQINNLGRVRSKDRLIKVNC